MAKFAMLSTVAAAMSWDEYKQQFGKVYNGDSEDAARKQVFESNQKVWGEHESGAILGATPFSDLTLEEFQALNIRGFAAAEESGLPNLGVHEYNGEDLSASVDWTTKGAVTPVKNQGQCGSCWAFSTTGGLEGAWEIASGNLVSLSEQQFVDCDKVDSGCQGGLMDNGFTFAESNAIATEDSYPYKGTGGSCKSSFTTGIPQGGVTGYKDVSASASALQSAINGQPVSVAIEADQMVFQQYTGGVISSGCGSQLDHGVLAVGYDGNTIKVKNSWGASWGVNGYVQIDASQCGITTSASYPKVSASAEVSAPAPMSWDAYKQQFGKVYNGDSEDAARKQVFESNQKVWGEHESGAVLGATPFSDLTLEEFQALPIRGFAASEESGLPNLGVHEYNGEDLSASVDWTTKGAVTPVKNQGQCGSCWAFSTTGGLEGAWEIASGNLVSLSEQQFVDCDKVDSGCQGGLMDNGFTFAESNAIATEDSYPYKGTGGSCKSSFTTGIPQGGVTGYKDVSASSSALQSAINGQPVSVAIEADQMVFQQYTGGVISSGCGSQLDHGVLAVGYNGNTIKVKNSWGASWGVNGYVQIDASQCGITTSASFPKVSASVEV